jgi:pilus assembly protein CpaC
MSATMLASAVSFPEFKGDSKYGLFSNLTLINTANAATPQNINGSKRTVQIIQGKSSVITTHDPISEIIIANPDIVEARALQSNRISFIGLELGSTNVLILDADGNTIESIDLDVSIDEKALDSAIKELFPNEDINVKTIGDEVILSGSASSGAVATSIRELALRFTSDDEGVVNMIDVAGEQQVMINVRVLEISRSILNELGIETEFSSSILNGEGSSLLSVTDSLGLSISPSYAIGSLSYSNGGFGPLNIVLRALERDGIVNERQGRQYRLRIPPFWCVTIIQARGAFK